VLHKGPDTTVKFSCQLIVKSSPPNLSYSVHLIFRHYFLFSVQELDKCAFPSGYHNGIIQGLSHSLSWLRHSREFNFTTY